MTALPAPDIRSQFLDGMSRAATMVSIVATDGTAGRAGVTVSAFSSVSADTDRPTLLVCINANSSAADAILANRAFSVNLLREDQAYISDVFAGRHRDFVADKFDCAKWVVSATGAPCLMDALVVFDCRTVSVHRVGSHHVLFGEVEAVATGAEGRALIYARRDYGAPQPIARSSVDRATWHSPIITNIPTTTALEQPT